MQRIVLTVLTAGLLYVGAAALFGGRTALADNRPPYDPFAMRRAAEANRGTQDREDFERRQDIIRRLKDHVKPPHRPGTRSPFKPNDGNNGHGNDDDHDDEDNPGQGGGNHGTGNNGNGEKPNGRR
jgi:hypothetical protein